MSSPDNPVRRAGRPPIFGPNQKRPTARVHLNMGVHVWKALENYAEDVEEYSLSGAARRIISDKLVELGYLRRERVQYSTQTRPGEGMSKT